MHRCCLCSQIAGESGNDLLARMLPGEPYVRRVMLEDAAFAVMPSLGPLAPGHVLLCPKTHVRSFAALDRDFDRALAAMKEALRAALQEVFPGDVHVFEHGSARAGERVLCSVDHAHLHFVPLPAALSGGLLQTAEWQAFDGSLTALRHIAGDEEYLLYEPPSGTPRALTAKAGRVESQYMRRLIAEQLGNADDWNWRSAPALRVVEDTWRRFAAREA